MILQGGHATVPKVICSTLPQPIQCWKLIFSKCKSPMFASKKIPWGSVLLLLQFSLQQQLLLLKYNIHPIGNQGNDRCTTAYKQALPTRSKDSLSHPTGISQHCSNLWLNSDKGMARKFSSHCTSDTHKSKTVHAQELPCPQSHCSILVQTLSFSFLVVLCSVA